MYIRNCRLTELVSGGNSDAGSSAPRSAVHQSWNAFPHSRTVPQREPLVLLATAVYQETLPQIFQDGERIRYFGSTIQQNGYLAIGKPLRKNPTHSTAGQVIAHYLDRQTMLVHEQPGAHRPSGVMVVADHQFHLRPSSARE